MYVIAGLGNPGRKYEGTRHNSGFAALDILAERYRIPVASERMKGLCGSGLIDAVACLLENGILDESGLLDEDQSCAGNAACTRKGQCRRA